MANHKLCSSDLAKHNDIKSCRDMEMSCPIKSSLNSQELIPQEFNGHISKGDYLNMLCDVWTDRLASKIGFDVSFIIYSSNPLGMYLSSRLYKENKQVFLLFSLSLLLFFSILPKNYLIQNMLHLCCGTLSAFISVLLWTWGPSYINCILTTRIHRKIYRSHSKFKSLIHISISQ